ncbi:MAG: NUDIX domain-containing protein [Nevskia sp.]|nr:NUDIX domain-containing protein [Nevskia sp.]
MSYTYDYPHYAVTADIVVFTIRDGTLQVLLVKRGAAPFKGRWALPGGYLKPDEDLEGCARRELEEETGLAGFYLEQLYTFGAIKRDPRERVITVAYFALIRSDAVSLRPATDVVGADWTALDALPPLAFDHEQIIAYARERLAAKLDYSTLAFQFLPERFTMRELHAVYETVLGKPLDRRNFYKKMLASGELQETAESRLEGAHRPAAVYRLRHPGEVRITR